MNLSRYPKYTTEQEAFLEFISIRCVSVTPNISTPREQDIQEQVEQGMLDLFMEYLGWPKSVMDGRRKEDNNENI